MLRRVEGVGIGMMEMVGIDVFGVNQRDKVLSRGSGNRARAEPCAAPPAGS
jgi:hypothetical protein